VDEEQHLVAAALVAVGESIAVEVEELHVAHEAQVPLFVGIMRLIVAKHTSNVER